MATRSNPDGFVLGLDVGTARIGIAVVSTVARLPRPVEVLARSDSVFEDIERIADREGARLVVVGVPRNLAGEETAQSREIRAFARLLEQKIALPVAFADETLSSVRAEAAARADTKLAGRHLDALAACYILEEFLTNQIKVTT